MNEEIEFFKKLKDFLLSLGAKNEEEVLVYQNKGSVIELDEHGQFYNNEIFVYTKGRGFVTADIKSLLDIEDEKYFFLWGVLEVLGVKRNIILN